jgi:hypothetical protein
LKDCRVSIVSALALMHEAAELLLVGRLFMRPHGAGRGSGLSYLDRITK